MASMRKAINAKCKECIYDPQAIGAGTWRQQVADCTSPGCPLYPFRPMPAASVATEKTAKLAPLPGNAT